MNKNVKPKKVRLSVEPGAITIGSFSLDELDEASRQRLVPTLAETNQLMREIRQGFFLYHAISPLLRQHQKIRDSVHVVEWCDKSPRKFREWFEKWKVEPDIEFLRLLIWAAQDQGVSQVAAERARQKNAKPRGWVVEQWEKREDKGQSKASFARQHAPLVKKHFDVDVTPEHVSREWLPKG